MKCLWSEWNNLSNLGSKSYICGHCGDKIGSSHGYFNTCGAHIYICTNCGFPTLFYKGEQIPGPLLGRDVNLLPSDVQEVYKELRDSLKNSNHTAVQLLGRKLIMHLAVDKAGAKEGDTFLNYVDHLKKSGYIPPTAGAWIELIKKIGNDANHEIILGSQEQSEKIVKFIEILLIFMYELSEQVQSDK